MNQQKPEIAVGSRVDVKGYRAVGNARHLASGTVTRLNGDGSFDVEACVSGRGLVLLSGLTMRSIKSKLGDAP